MWAAAAARSSSSASIAARRRTFVRPRISSARCRCSTSTTPPRRARIRRSPGFCVGMAAAHARDREELFRRMLFNVLCGNRDDHLKNHALLHDERGWRLSPAFDVVPQAGDRRAGTGDRRRGARRHSDHRELLEPLRRIRACKRCREGDCRPIGRAHAGLAERVSLARRSGGDDRPAPPRVRAGSFQRRR